MVCELTESGGHDAPSAASMLASEREAAIRLRWRTGDLKEWKRRERYHTRSLAETAMGRFKGILVGCIRSRTFESQATEVFVKAGILNLNRMCAQGMPKRE